MATGTDRWVRRHNRRTRWFHAAIYLATLTLLGTGWWLLSGLEGDPSPLARITGQPDTTLHTVVGWAFTVLVVAGLTLGFRAVRTFVTESLRFRRGDLRWFARWPAATLTGRFPYHDGHFDPGQRLINLMLAGGLLVLAGSGAGMAWLHGGPVFVVLVQVHKWTTYLVTLLVAGHVAVASGVLPGYRGVWRSMHLGGRLDRLVALRLWPGWTARHEQASGPRRPGHDAMSSTSPGKAKLALLLGTLFMPATGFSIVIVALPAVGRGVGLGLDDLQWVVTAYLLPAAGFMPLSARLTDLAGRRRMLLIGLVLLAAACLGAGLATGPATLLAARAMQGLATAVIVPAALALVTKAFPEGALGALTTAGFTSGALTAAGFTGGALLGGVLTELFGWRSAFLVNVPVSVIILALAPRLIPADAGGRHDGLSARGALTLALSPRGALAMVLGLLALVGGRGIAFSDSARWSLFPSVPRQVPAHARRWPVAGLGGFAAVSMATGLTFLMTVHLQETLGLSPVVTGLAFGAAGALAIAGRVLAPRLIAALGAPAALVLGLGVQGLFTVALLATGDAWYVTAALAGCCFGSMVAFVSANSGLPDHERRLAAGFGTTAQRIGIAAGIPVLSAVATAFGDLHAGVSVAAALTAVALIALLGHGAWRWSRTPASVAREK